MKSSELREQRAKLISDSGKLIAKAQSEKRSMSAEEQEQVDKILDAAEKMQGDIQRVEKQEALEASLSEVRTAPNLEQKSRTAVKPEERHGELWTRFLRDGVDKLSRSEVEELRAINVTTAAEGGYAAPQLAAQGFSEYLRNFAPVRLAPVTVISTASGAPLPWPTVNDTSNSGARTAEFTAVADNVDPTFASITFNAYNYNSNMLIVTRQWLADSTLPVDSWLNRMLAERVAAKQNLELTTGDGTGDPQGIVYGSTKGVDLPATTLGADNATIISNLNDLVFSIPAVYRKKSSVGWMFTDGTLKVLAKLVDSTGRPLFAPSLVAGVPDQLLGYPIYHNSDMDDIGATKKSILFGDFSSYMIRDVGGVSIVRTDERYIEKLAVGFIAFTRMDARYTVTGVVKHGLHAAS